MAQRIQFVGDLPTVHGPPDRLWIEPDSKIVIETRIRKGIKRVLGRKVRIELSQGELSDLICRLGAERDAARRENMLPPGIVGMPGCRAEAREIDRYVPPARETTTDA